MLLKHKIFYFIFGAILSLTLLYAEDNIEKYKFSFYVLLKGKIIKNIPRYDFGYRIEKTYPLRVKEFLLTSKYYNINNPALKNTAENEILSNINPEYRRKNAYYVTAEIFNFIKNKIFDENPREEFKLNHHELFKYPSEVIKEGKGNLIEKCRLAVALCRYLIIPARISYWNNHYVVEYYLQPLKGKGHWFIMDFEREEIDIKDERIKSVEWFPIDKDEQLNEQWNDEEIFLKRNGVKEIVFGGDNNLAKENFEKFKRDEVIQIEDNFKDKFYLVRKTDYEIWFKRESENKKAKVTFMLPFNNRYNFKNENSDDDLKTIDYFVKSESADLKVKYKRTHTRINPPQTGIIYTLPVEFVILNTGK